MTKSIEIEDARRSIRRLQQTGHITIALLALTVGGWAYNAEISGAVIASGQIVVESSRKKVQHPGGGIDLPPPLGPCIMRTRQVLSLPLSHGVSKGWLRGSPT